MFIKTFLKTDLYILESVGSLSAMKWPTEKKSIDRSFVAVFSREFRAVGSSSYPERTNAPISVLQGRGSLTERRGLIESKL